MLLKRYRPAFLLFFISSSLILGCSAFQYLDGSSDAEIAAFCSGKQVNSLGETPEMERRRKEIEKMANQLAQKEAAMGMDSGEKSKLLNQIGLLKDDVSELEQQIAMLEEENASLKKDKGPLTAISSSLAPLRIKVLSGNGSLLSAKQMAAKLRKSGYNIDRTDIAPSTDFPREKVFFAKGFDLEAKELSEYLSTDSVVVPLTWKSIFDIIVVTRNENFVK